jgi:hypothetical protein
VRSLAHPVSSLRRTLAAAICALSFGSAGAAAATIDLTPRELTASGDPVEDFVAVDAFRKPVCLGADGRVATKAIGVGSETGLLCVDEAGAHKIARRGEPAPDGGILADFHQCAIVGDDFLFSASRAADEHAPPGDISIYRATAAGIERVVGPGHITATSAVIRELTGPSLRSNLFKSNPAGTVVVFARTDDDTLLLRRRRGGPLEEVDFALEDDPLGRTVATLSWVGLADDDSVVTQAVLEGGGATSQALLASDGTRTRIVAEFTDPRLPGAPVNRFEDLELRGDRLFAFGYADGDGLYHALNISLADGSAHDVLTPMANVGLPWGLRDATQGGRLLFDTLRDYEPVERFLLDGDELIRLSSSGLARSEAIAVNERGNVLARREVTAQGASAIALTGPPADAICFVPPTAMPRQLPTATPTATAIDCAVSNNSKCVRLAIGSAAGRPGERVAVAVRLLSGALEVAGVQVDLHFVATAPFAGTKQRGPSCRVNPAIRKPQTTYGFQPPNCQPGMNCDAVRALVLSFQNTDPIPDRSVLFECDLDIAADAAPGRYAIAASDTGFSDPDGNDLDGGITPGTLEVLSTGQQPSGIADSSISDGCQLDGQRSSMWHGWLLAGLGISAMWRRLPLPQGRGEREGDER